MRQRERYERAVESTCRVVDQLAGEVGRLRAENARLVALLHAERPPIAAEDE